MSGFFYVQFLMGEKFMPNEVEVSPIFSTTLTINVRVFLCSIFNGRARSEAISRPKGVAYAERKDRKDFFCNPLN